MGDLRKMMPLINPTAATPELLAQIIEQHIASATELLEILKQERQALIAGKPEALEQVSTTKLQSINAFKLLGEKLNRYLGNESIDKLLARVGDGLNLQQRWQKLLAMAMECQKNNLANGAIIDERQNYVRHAIKSLFGQEARPAVYGRSGDTHFRPERHIIASA
jgi:flagellar biosynthesis/type III secretory pathway chaperone